MNDFYLSLVWGQERKTFEPVPKERKSLKEEIKWLFSFLLLEANEKIVHLFISADGQERPIEKPHREKSPENKSFKEKKN